MSTRGNICVKVKQDDFYKVTKIIDTLVYKETPYIYIYNHSDSYPDGLGKKLKEDYNSYEKALDLVLEGDCSFPGSPYKDREGYKHNKPRTAKYLEKAFNEEYLYVFQDEAWYLVSENNELEKL